MFGKRLVILVLLLGLFSSVRAQDERVKTIPIPSTLFTYALSPDGRLAAVYENSNFQGDVVYPELLPVRVFDLETGEEIAVLTEQTDYASGAAFSPDGAMLATYHNNGYLYLWDTESWELIRRIPAFPGGGQLRFLPDGQRLAARITGQPGSVAIWELETGAITSLLTPRYDTWEQHKEAEFNRRSGPNPMAALEPLPNGDQVLVVMSTGEFRLWDIASSDSRVWRAVEEERAMFTVREVDFSRDGRRLGYFDRASYQMVVADAASGETIASFNTGEAANSGALSPDGETVAWTDGLTIFVASVAQPDAVTEIPLDTEELNKRGQPDLEFMDDGSAVVLGGLVSLESTNVLFIVNLEG